MACPFFKYALVVCAVYAHLHKKMYVYEDYYTVASFSVFVSLAGPLRTVSERC